MCAGLAIRTQTWPLLRLNRTRAGAGTKLRLAGVLTRGASRCVLEPRTGPLQIKLWRLPYGKLEPTDQVSQPNSRGASTHRPRFITGGFESILRSVGFQSVD